MCRLLKGCNFHTYATFSLFALTFTKFSHEFLKKILQNSLPFNKHPHKHKHILHDTYNMFLSVTICHSLSLSVYQFMSLSATIFHYQSVNFCISIYPPLTPFVHPLFVYHLFVPLCLKETHENTNTNFCANCVFLTMSKVNLSDHRTRKHKYV